MISGNNNNFFLQSPMNFFAILLCGRLDTKEYRLYVSIIQIPNRPHHTHPPPPPPPPTSLKKGCPSDTWHLWRHKQIGCQGANVIKCMCHDFWWAIVTWGAKIFFLIIAGFIFYFFLFPLLLWRATREPLSTLFSITSSVFKCIPYGCLKTLFSTFYSFQ